MTFLLSVPPSHATGSVMTATSVTPLRLDAMLRCGPIPLSDEVGASPRITLAPGVRGSDPSGPLHQALLATNTHL
jgi:hypothetical protein